MSIPRSIRVLAEIRRRAGYQPERMTLAQLQAARRSPIPAVPVLGPLLERLTDRIVGGPQAGVEVREVTVPGAEGDLAARLHVPDGPAGARPLVLHLHGGGWTVGEPELYDWLCGRLAADLGAVVVSVDYRKAPEDPAPAALEDAVAVARWILVEGGGTTLGAEGPLVVAGDSAGGNLAALVAIALRDAGLDGLVAQLLIYPSTDLTMSSESATTLTHEPLLHRSDMEAFRRHYLSGGLDPKDPRVSPLHVDDLTGLAPACIITAEFDPLRDEGRAYAERLAEAGVQVRLTEYVDMPHGFVSLPGLTISARQAAAELVAFTRPLLAR